MQIIIKYYGNLDGLLKLCNKKKILPKNFKIKILMFQVFLKYQLQFQKILKNMMHLLHLGCVIKGQTPHFDFISQATIDAIMNLSIENKKPIGNGIITCLNMKQAKEKKKKRC